VVRRSTVWGQLRTTNLPPPDHASFREHDDICEAVAGRDPDRAAEFMRIHLRTVRTRVFASLDS
jgi:GntR family uxuAB operon transcriptional repressor